MRKIIVIGAGAAGMMAGIAAAHAGAAVTIFEKMRRRERRSTSREKAGAM